MSRYGVAWPSYWTGPTGQDIQRLGGKSATLLGAYLMFNDSMNMLGLYRVMTKTITIETPLTARELPKAFAVLAQVEYADYDAVTEFVWVREMARYRLALTPDKPHLDSDDKRVKGAQSIYEALGDNPFLAGFFQRYGKALHLRRLRSSDRYPQPVALGSPIEAPSKPVTENRSTEKPVQKNQTDLAPSAPALHPIRELFTHFDTLHQQHLSARAVIDGGKDGHILKGLLTVYGEPQLRDLMVDFFRISDEWLRKRGYTIGTFKTQIPGLLSQRSRKQQTSQPGLTGVIPEHKRHQYDDGVIRARRQG